MEIAEIYYVNSKSHMNYISHLVTWSQKWQKKVTKITIISPALQMGSNHPNDKCISYGTNYDVLIAKPVLKTIWSKHIFTHIILLFMNFGY